MITLSDEVCQVKMKDKNPCGRQIYKDKKKCIFHLKDKSDEEAKTSEIAFWKELERMEKDNDVKELDFTDFIFTNKVSFEKRIFEKPVIFEGAQFNNEADFSHAQFNNNAHFTATKFKKLAYFSTAHFSKVAVFLGAQFDYKACFLGAHFNNNAYFISAQFNCNAYFMHAQYKKLVDFAGAYFNNEANFSGAKFNDEVSFRDVQFSKEVDFADAQFNNEVFFRNTKFNDVANFSDAQFNDVLDFIDAKFNNKLIFSRTKIKERADFSEVHFNNEADFSHAQFNRADFDYVKFHKPKDVRFHRIDLSNALFLNTDLSEVEFLGVNWRNNGRLVILDEIRAGKDKSATYGAVAQLYRGLRRNYETNYRFAEAGDFFIGEMEMRRHDVNTSIKDEKIKKIVLWFKRNFSLLNLYKYLSLYGESYVRPTVWAIIIIFSYPMLMHWLFNASLPQSDDFLYTYLRTSVASFFQMDNTYLGERLIGVPLIGLFFIALKRKYERKK